MVVRLRLSPHRLTPSSRQKVYHIVAINAPKGRDKAPIETLGVYDAVPKHVPVTRPSERSLLDEGKPVETRFIKRIEWDRERVQYWIGTGAQPTRRMAWLLAKENLIPPGRTFHGYKGPPKPASTSAGSASTASGKTASQGNGSTAAPVSESDAGLSSSATSA